MRTLAVLASVALLVWVGWLTVTYFQDLSGTEDTKSDVADLERYVGDLERQIRDLESEVEALAIQIEETGLRRREQSLAAIGFEPAVCDGITPYLSKVNFANWSDEAIADWFYERYDVDPPSAGTATPLSSMTIEETLKALGAFTPTPEEHEAQQQRQAIAAIVKNRVVIEANCWSP